MAYNSKNGYIMTDKKACTNRSCWIDMAKLMAIIAVLIDHTRGLYENLKIAFFSYYSVSLFILLMGVTNYWAYERHTGNMLEKVRTSCWKII